MHTVEMYELVKSTAEDLGYEVREEDLGGVAGGLCEFAGRKYIFVDLNLTPPEQLDQLATSLASDPAIYLLELAPELSAALGIARAA